MSISGSSSSDTYEKHASTVDASKVGVATGSMHVGDHSHVSLFVESVSGSHDKHVITLQASPDGKRWFDTEYSIQGSGFISCAVIVANEVRVCVTTGEGAESKVEIDIISR